MEDLTSGNTTEPQWQKQIPFCLVNVPSHLYAFICKELGHSLIKNSTL